MSWKALTGLHTLADYSSSVRTVLTAEETFDHKTPDATPYGDSVNHATIGIGVDLTVVGNFNAVLSELGIFLNNTSLSAADMALENKYYYKLKEVLVNTDWVSDTSSASSKNGALIKKLNYQLSARAAQKYMISLYGGGAIPTALALTADEANDVFDRIRPNYDKVVDKFLSGFPRTSREYLALESLAWNAPALLGPSLKADINAGDRAEAWYEIRYNSGPVSARRDFESDLFGLYDQGKDTTATITASLAEATFEMVAHHHADIFSSDGVLADSYVSSANKSYSAATGLFTGLTVNTLASDLDPATQYFNSHYGNGQTFDDAHILAYRASANQSAFDASGISGNLLIYLRSANNFTDGAGVSLNGNDDTVCSYTTCSINMGASSGRERLFLKGQTFIVESSKITNAKWDKAWYFGENIAATIKSSLDPATGTAGGLSASGKTYDLSGGTLVILQGTATEVVIFGFHPGDFGVNFTYDPKAQSVGHTAASISHFVQQAAALGREAGAIDALATPFSDATRAPLASAQPSLMSPPG